MENLEQVTIDDLLNENVEQTNESVVPTVEVLDYNTLDKVDLVRLLKDKDVAIASYENERNNINDHWSKEIASMNTFYTKRIEELKKMLGYYERKFKFITDFINIEQTPKVEGGK